MFRQVNSKLVFSVVLQSVLVLSFLTACQKDDNTKKLRASRTQQGKPTDPNKQADPSKPADDQSTPQDGQKSEIKASLGLEKVEDIKNEKVKSSAASVVVIEVGSGESHQTFTGFISNDGAQVITAVTNLVGTLTEEMKSASDEKIKEYLKSGNIKIKMAISDHTEKVLITNIDEVKIVSLTEEQQEFLASSIKAYNAVLSGARNAESTVLPGPENVVRLALDKKIGSPLKLVEPKENEKVYIAGYSEKTTGRAELKAKDADGKSVVVSSGTLVDFKEAIKSFEDKLSDEELEVTSLSALATNADSTASMVGSPILNEQGDVVGIFLRSSNDLKTKRSIGLSTNSF